MLFDDLLLVEYFILKQTHLVKNPPLNCGVVGVDVFLLPNILVITFFGLREVCFILLLVQEVPFGRTDHCLAEVAVGFEQVRITIAQYWKWPLSSANNSRCCWWAMVPRVLAQISPIFNLIQLILIDLLATLAVLVYQVPISLLGTLTEDLSLLIPSNDLFLLVTHVVELPDACLLFFVRFVHEQMGDALVPEEALGDLLRLVVTNFHG